MSILQTILKFDQNLIRFLLQNWSKFDQKSIKKLYRILPRCRSGYFLVFFCDFCQIWFQNGRSESVRNCRRLALMRTWPFSGFQKVFVIDFGPWNDQKGDLASTKCTFMSVLNVETQGFCNAFSNFLTFFQSKKTSRCPKLLPNDYFCSRGDPFSMGLGEVSLLSRNPWNVKKTLQFF